MAKPASAASSPNQDLVTLVLEVMLDLYWVMSLLHLVPHEFPSVPSCCASSAML